MDAGVVTLALAGAACGLAASAVPGFHVNALAVLALAALPAGEEGAVFLVAAFAASPFGIAIASPFLGGTTEDAALQGLPAHQLAREGRALEAVALQAWGAFAGIVFALPLALAARSLLRAAEPSLADAMPWLLLGILVLLVATERARLPVHRRRRAVGWRGPGARDGFETVWEHGPLSGVAGKLAALVVLALAGALGLAAFRLGARSPFDLPASPLLPLLAGLFAAPGLAAMLGSRRGRFSRARLRAPRPPRGELWRATLPGAGASALLGIAPGVSASHAALLLPRAKSPEATLARMAAVNGGAVVFTLLAWHALGKARSGALVAAETLAPPVSWRAGWAPPAEVAREAALVLLVAGIACLAARLIAAPLSRAAVAAGPHRIALTGLAILVIAVAAFTGALGLAEFVVAAAIGWLPHRWGVRRSHAMGVILVPALLRAWGF